MKKNVHPDNYRFVVFEDLNNGERFLTRSTANSEETTKWEDGNVYPVIKVHISSTSHPFFTGQEKLVDIEGRVDKFEARRKAHEAAKKATQARTSKKTDKKSEEKSEPTKLGTPQTDR